MKRETKFSVLMSDQFSFDKEERCVRSSDLPLIYICSPGSASKKQGSEMARETATRMREEIKHFHILHQLHHFANPTVSHKIGSHPYVINVTIDGPVLKGKPQPSLCNIKASEVGNKNIAE